MTATIVLALVMGACMLAVALALRSARRNARRLEELSQLYWQLQYEVRELQLSLERQARAPGEPASRPPKTASAEVFVPLTSLKR